MKNQIIGLFEQKKIKVNKLIERNTSNIPGLLHGPIYRYEAYTDIGVLQLVIKSESIVAPPELLFQNMYLDCANGILYQSVLNFKKYSKYLSMCNMPQRERLFYTHVPSSLQNFLPKVWGCVIHEDNQLIIMEDLSDCINIDKIDNPEAWNREYLLQVMIDLANIHHKLHDFEYNIVNAIDFKIVKKYLLEFHNVSTYGCGIKMNSKVYSSGILFIEHIEEIEVLLSQDATIIHNDFNIRNICISKNKENIKVYDWEFWDIGCPMLDIVDFLISISTKYINTYMIEEMIETYISNYYKLSGKNFNKRYCIKLLYYSALKYSATRMNMYLLCYKKKRISFIERMYDNLQKILEICESNFGEGLY